MFLKNRGVLCCMACFMLYGLFLTVFLLELVQRPKIWSCRSEFAKIELVRDFIKSRDHVKEEWNHRHNAADKVVNTREVNTNTTKYWQIVWYYYARGA